VTVCASGSKAIFELVENPDDPIIVDGNVPLAINAAGLIRSEQVFWYLFQVDGVCQHFYTLKPKPIE
jgi:hypothetical protein